MGCLQFVGWGGCEISFCVSERGVDWGCLGNCVRVPSMYTYSYVYKWVTFWYVQCNIGKPYYLWTKSKVLWYCIHSFTYLGLIVYYLYCKSLSYVLNSPWFSNFTLHISKCNPLIDTAVSIHGWYSNTIPITTPVHTPSPTQNEVLHPPHPTNCKLPTHVGIAYW